MQDLNNNNINNIKIQGDHDEENPIMEESDED